PLIEHDRRQCCPIALIGGPLTATFHASVSIFVHNMLSLHQQADQCDHDLRTKRLRQGVGCPPGHIAPLFDERVIGPVVEIPHWSVTVAYRRDRMPRTSAISSRVDASKSVAHGSLTSEQVHLYDEEGYLVLPGLL